ncbi:hypothetical protein A2U01_0066885, partial [Trifolium medium]|nr:hypothetical protein [Trifolium medium]
MSSLRTLPNFQERSDAAIERYKLAIPRWRERVSCSLPATENSTVVQSDSFIRKKGFEYGVTYLR